MEEKKDKKRKKVAPIEIIPDKLYWISDKDPPRSSSSAYYFCIDDALVYNPFWKDFGPLNMAMMHKFCKELEKLMKSKKYNKYKIYHYTSTEKEKQANAAFLMGAFMIIVLKYNANKAWEVFKESGISFKPFRDAIMGESTYKCTIKDCLNGLYFGIELGWYDYETFDTKIYEKYEKVENGDMNWIVPGKFLAFAGPASKKYDEDGYRQYTPDDYNPVFKKFNVDLIVRLNKKKYDETIFSDYGFEHLDIPFEDGTIPPQEVIDKFLERAEDTSSAIAIHCKAGLGRTGTLIGLYCMKHYGFPAAAFIGWSRICRPGSVLGPQQHYLNEVEEEMMKQGDSVYKKEELISKMGVMTLEDKKVEMSPDEKRIRREGDKGQAKRLKNQKRKHEAN